MRPRRVVIVGVGLMGGSLGLALRRRSGYRVVGLSRRPVALAHARRRNVLHEGFTDPARALAGADAVVLCTPVDEILPTARRLAPWIPPSARVTDVGSVKGPLVRGMNRLFRGPGAPAFVGAHPMTGSEKTGVANARADLYDGAACALTPAGADPAAARAVERLWTDAGARVFRIAPGAHDRAVALVSHLPHLMADALVLTAGAERGAAARRALRVLAAGSFRDATRVASADPALWRGIFEMNEEPVRRAAALFQKTLAGLVARRWPLSTLQKVRRLNAGFRKN